MAGKEIADILNRFFEEQGWELTASEGEDFEYMYSESEVHFQITETPTLQGIWFDDWVRSKPDGTDPYIKPGMPGPGLGLKNYPGNFIMSILHEVGHYNLDNDYTDPSDYKGDPNLQKCIRWSNKNKDNLDGNKQSDCLIYFNCPEEREATQWAVDWLEKPKNQEALDNLKSELSEFVPIACM